MNDRIEPEKLELAFLDIAEKSKSRSEKRPLNLQRAAGG